MRYTKYLYYTCQHCKKNLSANVASSLIVIYYRQSPKIEKGLLKYRINYENSLFELHITYNYTVLLNKIN